MKIGASSVTSQEVIDLPLVQENLTNELFIEGLKLRETVSKRRNSFSEITENPNGALIEIELIHSNENCAVLTNGRVTVEVGGKVIREHMATMGAELFLGKTDDDIHNSNEILGEYNEAGIKFLTQPEYWILFEYFFAFKSFANLARGVFHLTQQCLITLNPEKAILRFVRWFDASKRNYIASTDFINVVEDWLQSDNEVYFLQAGLQSSIAHCQGILAITNKHLSAHSVFLFTHNITEYALNNIQKTSGGRFLFSPVDNFQDVNFWKGKIGEFGTGLVKYTDAVIIHGSEAYCEKMIDSFNFLMSSSLVVRSILKNQIEICPFLYDIPICKAAFRDSDNCNSNPFLMLQQDSSGKECLFGNGVLLMGMQGRINFDSEQHVPDSIK